MKRFSVTLVIVSLVIGFSYYLNSQSDQDDVVVAKVGDENITFGDLQRAYNKNINSKSNGLKDISKDSVYKFLNLYINYRLKVADAEMRGYDEEESVQSDIKENRRLLAESFYHKKELIEPGVDRLLEMRKREIKIAYIVTAYRQGPETDTTAAWEKINNAYDEIQNGADFGTVAGKYSEEKRTAGNDGVLENYLTSGKIFRPIEEAIYSVPQGEVSDIIPIKSGYVILKVLENVPRIRVAASQILIAYGDSAEVYGRAFKVKRKLEEGESFAKLAKEYSEDKPSAENGGAFTELYSRSTGFDKNGVTLPTKVEKTLFKLEDGQVSQMLQTDNGLVFIRRDSTVGLDLEKERKALEAIYKKAYLLGDKTELYDSLKRAYDFYVFDVNLNDMLENVDKTKTNLEKDWDKNISEEIREKTLFRILNRKYSVDEFTKILNEKPELRGIPTNMKGIKRAINMYVEPIVLDKVTEDLEEKYPDFAFKVREFRDGILMYRVEAEEVWNKLKFDSAAAYKYWESRKSEFITNTQYDISEIFVLSDSTAKEIKQELENGASFNELAKKYTERKGYREKDGRWGIVDPEKNKLADIAHSNKMKEGDYSGPHKYGAGFSFIYINEYYPPREKTFEEAISDFAPKFQDMLHKKLTNQWLDRIKEKVPVKIYKDKLNKVLN